MTVVGARVCVFLHWSCGADENTHAYFRMGAGGVGARVCTCGCVFVREGVCLLYLGVYLMMKMVMMMVCVQR